VAKIIEENLAPETGDGPAYDRFMKNRKKFTPGNAATHRYLSDKGYTFVGKVKNDKGHDIDKYTRGSFIVHSNNSTGEIKDLGQDRRCS
jgi:hypothetical protein